MCNGMSYENATNLWYNSKTKYMLLDWEYPLLAGVSPMRAYDELLMEIEGNPRWMKGQFE